MTSIPTLLTYLRIALIPVFVLVFFLPYDWVNIAVTAIFGVAAVTDWLDGYLARKLGQMSRFGAFLDPVADKLIVGVALVLLVQAHPTFLMTVAAAVIIGREITVSALREWMAEIGERAQVAVSNLGKWKTTAQMTALFMLLYRDPLLGIPMYSLGMVFLYIAVALTLWSMVLYLKAAWPVLSREE
ncbi:CDP-diacylglycerol--glycerol-3-phosphate 3-phosphatidyltransferase [Candidatus Tenderia electrophaga]|jgi:CDP-diacylglycerol--glycerol-3-phosphate 3-phosphatidyltransferase/cardiolipin synthase|uniref:CDP-diacylglycerol--glycerol-3-phosphate 3-phosphatidyltransferase n=1 Tax=Candidatus Tenderia electrophaga TaxID=1748243 RepID=A0A0S2TDM0_9GAMM|nr:CDP-diacylglycerol--glycerol-3-phosphate 3-phosphatidyltransferase [Candidatus Tenderia electrophaga]